MSDVRCPKCGGEGGERWHEPDGSENGERCDLCDGFGRIPAAVADALASARAEGAAEAFERAAKACDNVKAVHRADADRAAENDQPLAWSASDGCSITAENLAAAIRALAEKERGK